MEPLHLCIMGHSGVGKSPLSDLFDVPGWDPYRIRPPRDENDKAMSKRDFDALMKDTRQRGNLVYSKDDKRATIHEKYQECGLCVCEHWSFFKVRTADQCLRHADFNPNSSMRIEIFAPVLWELIKHRTELRSAFKLDVKNLLVVILNPTSRSFSEMDTPSPELRMATAMAVMERNRVSGKVPDLADALRRVEHLGTELDAWRSLINDNELPTLECLEWKHFEYRYDADATGERDRARSSLFKAFKCPKSWKGESPETWAGRLELSCLK